MTDAETDFSTAAIVVAHPDDELLWFASLVIKVQRIVLCYGSISKTSKRAVARRNLIEAYPLNTVTFLDLPIPPNDNPDAEVSADPALVERLSAALDGVSIVFTHNPWGEYGQPDHQRVYASVAQLQERMKFTAYVSGYVARHQLPRLDRSLGGGATYLTFPVRYREIKPIYRLYRDYDCWTWSRCWVWPAREHFIRLNTGEETGRLPILLFGSRRKRKAEMRQFWAKLWHRKARERFV